MFQLQNNWTINYFFIKKVVNTVIHSDTPYWVPAVGKAHCGIVGARESRQPCPRPPGNLGMLRKLSPAFSFSFYPLPLLT